VSRNLAFKIEPKESAPFNSAAMSSIRERKKLKERKRGTNLESRKKDEK